jgi:hypothetical protein
MAWKVMDRRASDNEYLHRDFHAALSCGLDYLRDRFGAEAVIEYLRTFTFTYHAPLRDRIRREGLGALREHYEHLYRTEGAEVIFEEEGNALVMRVPVCPAVSHMRAIGRAVSDQWIETERTVNAALVEGTGYAYELSAYDPQTGGSVQVFRRTSP